MPVPNRIGCVPVSLPWKAASLVGFKRAYEEGGFIGQFFNVVSNWTEDVQVAAAQRIDFK